MMVRDTEGPGGSAMTAGPKCLGAWWLNVQHQTPPNDAMSRGTMIHGELEDYFRGVCGPSRWPQLAKFVGWLKERMSHLFLGRSEVEVKFTNDGPRYSGNVDIQSWADILNITDWKTGAAYMLPDIEDDLQMVTYGVLAARKYGVDEVTVNRVLVDDLKIESLTLSGELLEESGKYIDLLATEMIAKKETRTTGKHCRYCRAKTHCQEYMADAERMAGPEVVELVRSGVIDIDNKGELRRLTDAASSVVSKAKTILKSGGKERKQADSYSPEMAFSHLLVRHGRKVALSAMKCSAASIKQALEAAGELKPEIEAAIKAAKE